ncbi:hypothetical protein MBANPS3_005720 [Mucor bainieri]
MRETKNVQGGLLIGYILPHRRDNHVGCLFSPLKLHFMSSDTYHQSGPSWSAPMDSAMDEPAIKLEPETLLDGVFELLVREHRECRFDPQNTIGFKRKREQDDMDQTYSENDEQYLDHPGESGNVDEVPVNEEPPEAMNQPDIEVQESPVAQGLSEAAEDTTKNEHYCCGCNDNIPTYSQFVEHILNNHVKKGIKYFHIKPDIKNPYNHCNACDRKFKTRAGYFVHLRRIHKFNIRPASDDNQQQLESSAKKQYYCCGCNRFMNDQASFSEHIRTTHRRTLIKHFHLMPDLNDPNWYCRACERRFNSKPLFSMHLRTTHKMKKAKNEDAGLMEEVGESEHYCCGCNQYMSDEKTLTKHIEKAHRRTKIKHLNLKPDVQDPNFYCKACERGYTKQSSFRLHLRQLHKMSDTPSEYYCSACNATIKEHSAYSIHITRSHPNHKIKRIHVRPDINDPNYYCKSCEKPYFKKMKYRHHLQVVHKIFIQDIIVRIPAISTNEPEYYCSGCNTVVHDYSTFVAHIRSQHPTSRIKNIHIKPDIHDPDDYCSACEKFSVTRKLYLKHLKLVHKILVDSTHTDPQHVNSMHSTVSDHDNTPLQSTNPTEVAALYTSTAATSAQQALGDTATVDLRKAKNYCHYCEKQYESQGDFRTHLRELHSFITTRSRGTIFSTALPQPKVLTPSEKKKRGLLPSLGPFKLFGKRKRKIKSQEASILPNPNKIEYKCDACKRVFRYKSVMREHCSSVHQMTLSPIPYKRNPRVIIRVSRKKSKSSKSKSTRQRTK